MGKNGALRWSILVGKQKHNVQKPVKGEAKKGEISIIGHVFPVWIGLQRGLSCR